MWRKEGAENGRFAVACCSIVGLTVAITVAGALLRGNGDVETLRQCILVLCLDFIFLFYIGSIRTEVCGSWYNSLVLILTEAAAFALLCLLPEELSLRFIWLLPSAILAGVVGVPAGVLQLVRLCGVYAVVFGAFPLTLLRYVLMALLLCVLVEHLKDFLSFFCILVIIAAAQLIFELVQQRMNLHAIFSEELLAALLTGIGTVLITLSCRLLQRVLHTEQNGEAVAAVEEPETRSVNRQKEELADVAAAYEQEEGLKSAVKAASEQGKTEQVDAAAERAGVLLGSEAQAELAVALATDDDVREARKDSGKRQHQHDGRKQYGKQQVSYQNWYDASFPLYLRLRDEAPKAYSHGIEVADLARKIAEAIGANTQLAYAGGFYHEVGRLKGKNYTEEGDVVAQEYGLPAELRAIIREHSYKKELPKTLESVIVMLSDNLISMLHFLEKNGKESNVERLVDNTFSMHLMRGTIEEADLSLREFKQLKQYFLEELQRREMKQRLEEAE